MLEYRAKTLVRLLVGMGLNTMVGITAEQFGDDDWNVVLAPMQTVDIVQLGFSGNPSPPQAKTGCEGIWTPGDGDGGYEF